MRRGIRNLGGVAALLLLACGGNVQSGVASRSCSGNPGAGHDCGTSHTMDCCASTPIPAGHFHEFNDPSFDTSVSGFKLDVFEVTVGRFRSFVDAWPGSRPHAGDGAHPKVSGTGWKTDWDHFLPATRDDFLHDLDCEKDPTSASYVTWTASAGANEQMPVECITWYEAFAFCAWDGGRLPTLAEWDYAAVGGDEQRKYPWGSAPPDPSHAVLDFVPNGAFLPVGSAPSGAARWGVLDMAGSRGEYLRDVFQSTFTEADTPKSCSDCIVLDGTDDRYFGVRDAYFNTAPENANVGEPVESGTATSTSLGAAFGIRCARD